MLFTATPRSGSFSLSTAVRAPLLRDRPCGGSRKTLNMQQRLAWCGSHTCAPMENRKTGPPRRTSRVKISRSGYVTRKFCCLRSSVPLSDRPSSWICASRFFFFFFFEGKHPADVSYRENSVRCSENILLFTRVAYKFIQTLYSEILFDDSTAEKSFGNLSDRFERSERLPGNLAPGSRLIPRRKYSINFDGIFPRRRRARRRIIQAVAIFIADKHVISRKPHRPGIADNFRETGRAEELRQFRIHRN